MKFYDFVQILDQKILVKSAWYPMQFLYFVLKPPKDFP